MKGLGKPLLHLRLAWLVATLPFVAGVSRACADTSPPSRDQVCAEIESAALKNGLPTSFFGRLIWQESRFDATARSPAGAEGIAQFMPRTASSRGLVDPFQFSASLLESAAYLKELRQTFGNLGLAAAAYNAGPARLGRWLSGQADLPKETADYVLLVTGYPVTEWNTVPPPSLNSGAAFACPPFASSGEASLSQGASAGAMGTPATVERARTKPWAVVLVGSLRQETALSEYQIVRSTFARILQNRKPTVSRRRIGLETTMRYVVQIEEDDQKSGNALCNRIRSSGGACAVVQNVVR